jgi:transcriptional regulator NrdR family protein
MDIKVKKKDGRIEAFDRNKIINGLVKSGALPDEANKVVAGVEAWAPTVAVEGVIGTMEIRGKVIELLRAVNPQAAADYESYRKPAAAPVA